MHASHTHPNIQFLLDGTPEERVTYIRQDRFIPYTRGNAVLSEISVIMATPAGVRPQCVLVIGAPGTGKTSLLEFAERSFNDGSQTRPMRCALVRINLPQIVNDLRLFYARILGQFGVPFSIADKPEFLHEQTVDALRDLET